MERHRVSRIEAVEGLTEQVLYEQPDQKLMARISVGERANGSSYLRLRSAMPTHANKENFATVDFVGGSAPEVDLHYFKSSNGKSLVIELRFQKVVCKNVIDRALRTEEKPEHRVFDYLVARSQSPEGRRSTIQITCPFNHTLNNFLKTFTTELPFEKGYKLPYENFGSSQLYRTTFQRAIKADYEAEKQSLSKACRSYYNLDAEFIPANSGALDWYHIRLRLPPGRPLEDIPIDIRAGMQFRLQFGKAAKLGKQYFQQDRKFTVTYSDERAIKESSNIVAAGLIHIPKSIFPKDLTGFSMEPCVNKTMYQRLNKALEILDKHCEDDSSAGEIYRTIYAALPMPDVAQTPQMATALDKIKDAGMDDSQK
ncbi:hypothetical protein TWF281_004470 [Arthrobotrys megalospora]